MKIDILASGSRGNCIHVQTGSVSILVDVGLPKTRIEKILLDNHIDLTTIKAIFLTHSHGDHTAGLPLANKYRIPVLAAEDEWKSIKGVDDDLQMIVEAGKHMAVHNGSDWIDVTPFRTHHDAFASLGYSMLGSDNEKVSICLDTGKVDEEMLYWMAESDIIVIEANYEESILVDNPKYPDYTKARILSDVGHLSNDQCAEALSRLIRGVGEKIFLVHLSNGDEKGNNFPWLAMAVVEAALKRKKLVKGKHYFLEVV